jgi:hypothetical protein
MNSTTKESSLTAPEDRNLNDKWRPELGAPSLSETEVSHALSELNVTSFVDKFPRVDRTFADPAINLQNYGLFSFIPAKGATPNEKGVFGFAKLRGNYASELEANQRAEFLIRNVDSYHKIFHCYVGRPFPLTESSSFSADTQEIDIRKQTTEAISTSIRDKKAEEQNTIREIKDREQKLLEESKRTEADPYEEYITLKVKKAQLSWTYLEHIKKMDEVKQIIIKTRAELDEMDKTYPEFHKTYYDKYMKAREEAGIKQNEEEAQDNFIKFLVEDQLLPGIDDE